MNITDRVKTYEDAVKIYEAEIGPLPPFNTPLHASKPTKKALLSEYKLSIIYKILNQGWCPDWSKNEQQKWYPYFYWWRPMSPFAFGGSYYDFWSAVSDGGSRLCLENRELADYAGMTFTSLYEPLFCGIVYRHQFGYNGRRHSMRQHNRNKVEHGVKVTIKY